MDVSFPKQCLLFLPILIFIASCGSGPEPATVNEAYRNVSGEAQGTTYSITYEDSTGLLFSAEAADSILDAIDMSLSEWVDSSVISVFNRSDSMVISDPHFLNVYFRGREISRLTKDAFEPKVMPLVHAWGFGPNGAQPKGDVQIDELMELVHTPFQVTAMDTTAGRRKYLFVKNPGQELDVNGIAQGYSVDVVGDYLRHLGIRNFMVEIGGEVLAYGKNARGESWKIGVDKPVDPDQPRELMAIVRIDDRAICTSGSYRKFYVKDGKKYSHTIDPTTGKPVDHSLISTTVLAPTCMDGDTFATAFMVMGVEGTKTFLKEHPELGLDVYLIFADKNGAWESYMSPGMKEVTEIL